MAAREAREAAIKATTRTRVRTTTVAKTGTLQHTIGKKNNVGQVEQAPEAGKGSEASGGITMVSDTGPQEAWLFAVVASVAPLGDDRLVIDSGACVHVCPRNFAAE